MGRQSLSGTAVASNCQYFDAILLSLGANSRTTTNLKLGCIYSVSTLSSRFRSTGDDHSGVSAKCDLVDHKRRRYLVEIVVCILEIVRTSCFRYLHLSTVVLYGLGHSTSVALAQELISNIIIN